MTYARYGLWHYVKKNRRNEAPYNRLQRAGRNLRGLLRVMLFKRFESSVYAFRATIERLLKENEIFLESLNRGMIPAGEEAQQIIYEAESAEDFQI